jgi:chaperone BCS1
LIHSLAGELGLDIYVVSLSSKGMNDNTLSSLVGNMPSRYAADLHRSELYAESYHRCILLLEDLDAAFTRSTSRDAAATGAPPGTTTAVVGTPAVATVEVKPEDDGSTLSLSGLLNALDGVAAAEGRLLFATTNHIERLDPALSRPGRMDVWVDFKHATSWQAENIFRCFFPVKLIVADAASTTAPAASDGPRLGVPGKSKPAVAVLTEDELDELSKAFGAAIPADEFSVASIQGYLLKNKTRPKKCVEEVHEW